MRIPALRQPPSDSTTGPCRRKMPDRPFLLDVGPKFCSMKITQEVRDFGAKQNAPVEAFVATEEPRLEWSR